MLRLVVRKLGFHGILCYIMGTRCKNICSYIYGEGDASLIIYSNVLPVGMVIESKDGKVIIGTKEGGQHEGLLQKKR